MNNNNKAPVVATKVLKVVFLPLGVLSMAIVSIVLAVKETSLVPLGYMTAENALAFTDKALHHAEQAVYGNE